MKVLMVNYEFPPLGGGGGVACHDIAMEIAKNHQMDYLTSGYKGLKEFEKVDGINVYRVPVLKRRDLNRASLLSMLSFFQSSILKGLELCKKNSYDVINTHFVVPSGPTGIYLSKMFGIPNVMFVHGGDIYDPTKIWSPHRHLILRKLIRSLLKRSQRVVTQSSNTMNNTNRYYKYDGKITIIPLGLVTPIFRKETRDNLGLLKDHTYLISVGRLVKRKGYDYAIRAISKLPYKNIIYLIIGDGPEEKNLRNLAIQLGIEDRIKILGFLPEEKKFQYLSASDIYVLSSLHEGFGICLLEAMYCGLPIVATDHGGQTDLLIDGRNALLIPAKNEEAMAQKIRELIEDKDYRSKMSNDNRNDVKKYMIENIAKQHIEVFKEVIQRAHAER